MKPRERVVVDGGDDEAAWIQTISLLHCVSQSAQVVASTYSDLVAEVHVTLLDVIGQEEELFCLFSLWDR